MTRYVAALLLGCAACDSDSNGPGPSWVYLRVDDCSGDAGKPNDAGVPLVTLGSATPDPSLCETDGSFVGLAAVCWDQQTLTNPNLSGPGCVYTQVPSEQCTGGAHPGRVYGCE